ncbi:serine protease [Methylobacterium sp. NEAU 140]|uniref:trypsin-like peptidase domain-containing protein n=1 Tax=Methylobacterium sp. NEAU 140 TaxID=3064945 RepID=UPI0027366BAE|nr:trypsin-like peptidase domain-containing protein [Methylobacterium sp. NEAU 140]MDP4024762.1 serine protease [Methylobacterium sp. NEAU 140]
MGSVGAGYGRRAGRGARGAVLGLVLAALPAAAQEGPARPQAPPARPAPAKPAPANPAPADPALDGMRAAFEALPEAERKALQDAMVWTGDFNAVVSGAFGRRTFEALTAFQARAGGGDPLAPRGRAAILAAGEAARKAARFRVAADRGSGAVIGVPEALLPRRTDLPTGTRWQSADGRVTLETRAYPPGPESLDTLFERAIAPLNGRKVTYKLRRPDFFVVTAETGAGLSYTRYAAGAEGLRGFLVGYDRALAPEVDRLVIAVANAFEPFPAAAPASARAPSPTPSAAASPTPSSAAPSVATATPAPRPAAGPALSAAAARPAGTGLAVVRGRVLTAAAALDGCAEPRVGGGPARVLATDPAGLALLDAPSAPAPALPPLRPDPLGDEPVRALAAGPDGAVLAPGEASAGAVTAPLQPGSAGAPVFDRAGRLAGLVARYPAAPRLIAGVAPPQSFPVVSAAALSAFLAGRGIAPTGPAVGPGAAAAAIVAVTCR